MGLGSFGGGLQLLTGLGLKTDHVVVWTITFGRWVLSIAAKLRNRISIQIKMLPVALVRVAMLFHPHTVLVGSAGDHDYHKN